MKRQMMTWMVVLLLLWGAPVMVSAAVYTYNGNTYHATTDLMGWEAAKAYADSTGGWLVSINDQAEQDWLNSVFGFGTRYWIGFNDIASEGTWVWDNGDTTPYTYWNGGEPNNARGEDVAVMNWNTSNGRWNDWDRDNLALAIVEVGENAVPVPGAVWLLGTGRIGLTGLGRRKTQK